MASLRTYTVAKLKTGQVYRDRLSGYLVLVREVECWSNTAIPKLMKRRIGWYYNPVWGKHMEMELHDYQFTDITRS